MINIPVNDPAALPSAKKTDAKRRDKLVKRILSDFGNRVICMCLWRSHAQATVDELNALAEGR